MTVPVLPPAAETRLRPAIPADIDPLLDLEIRAFAYDRMSRRSFLRLIASPTATLIAACQEQDIVGYALVLFRERSRVGRLYSIAVTAAQAGRGIGTALLAAAETAARRRGASAMRLEVHEHNAAAIRRYGKAGYVLLGRRAAYYDDGATALRYEKRLSPSSTGDENSSSPRGRRE